MNCVWCGHNTIKQDSMFFSGVIHRCGNCEKIWAEGITGSREVWVKDPRRQYPRSKQENGKWVSIPKGVLMIGREKETI